MKKSFLFVVASIFSLHITAQNIFHEWSFNPKDTAIYGGEVRISATTSDDFGNSYSTGEFGGAVNFGTSDGSPHLFSSGGSDIFVVKYDHAGNYLWSFGVGGSNSDYPASIAIENNEFIYITGTFYGSVDLDPSENEFILNSTEWEDIFIAKYDTAGNFIWAKALNGLQGDYVGDIEVDNNGHFYITGGFYGDLDFDPSENEAIVTTSGGQYIYIAKYDSDGNYIWAKTMQGDGFNCQGFDLSLDSELNIVITGRFSNSVDFDPSASEYILTANSGSIHFFIAKYTNNGNLMWAFSGGSSQNTEGTSLAIDSNDNIFLTGVFYGAVDFDPSANSSYLSATHYDIFLAKYNADGEYQWAKKIGGNGWYSRAYKVLVDSLQNIILTGYFEGGLNFDPSGSNFMLSASQSDGFLAKYSNNGNFQWAFKFGSFEYDWGVSIANGLNGNIILAGSFKHTIYVDSPNNNNTISSGTQALNSFLGSYSSTGNYQWANRIGGFTNNGLDQRARNVATDNNNNVIITGSFTGNVDFNPSESSQNFLLSDPNDTKVFLAKYNNNGEYLWAFDLDGTYYNEGRTVATTPQNDIILGGIFNNPMDFDPSETDEYIINPTVNNYNNVFLAKYSSSGSFIWAFKLNSNESAYISGTKTDSDGNIYISGYAYTTIDLDPSGNTFEISTGSYDYLAFLAKYNSNGEFVWGKPITGNNVLQIDAMDIDASGNVYATGRMGYTANFNQGNSNGLVTGSNGTDIFITKFSNSGNFAWVKVIKNNEYNYSEDIAVDHDNNLYITGYFRGELDFDPSANNSILDAGSTSDVFLAKYSTDGNFLWVRSLEGNEFNHGRKVVVDSDNSPVISGQFRGELICDTYSGNYTSLISNPGARNLFMVKYDSDGNFKTAKKIGGISSEDIYGMAANTQNEFYICGQFRNSANFNTNEPPVILNSVNGSDIFLAKYSMCDNYYIYETIQSCGPYTAFNGTTYTQSGIFEIPVNSFLPDCDTVYVLNLIVTEIDADVTVSNNTLTATYEEYNTQYQWYNCTDNQPIADATNQSFTPTANGSYKVKITNGNCVEFSDCVEVTNVSLRELESNLNISIYPNPTKGHFEVELNKNEANLLIEIYDLIGNKIVSVNSEGKPVVVFDLNQHASGVYLVKVSDKFNTKTLKLVKQ